MKVLHKHKVLNYFSIFNAIQQKVHRVGKLVFPNAVENGREDCKEQF